MIVPLTFIGYEMIVDNNYNKNNNNNNNNNHILLFMFRISVAGGKFSSTVHVVEDIYITILHYKTID